MMKIMTQIDEKDDCFVWTPMHFAAAMINQNLFKTDELEELAEYLLVYCRHNVTDNGDVCRRD